MAEAPDNSTFQVLVVASDSSGRLLGSCERIRTKQSKQPTQSLIPVHESQNLGHELWRVDFGDGNDLPTLELNASVESPGMSEIVRRDPAFRALIMPEVFRTVLDQIVFKERVDPNHNADGMWWDGWLQLAYNLTKERPPQLAHSTDDARHEDARDWINKVVAAFSQQRVRALTTYNEVQRART